MGNNMENTIEINKIITQRITEIFERFIFNNQKIDSKLLKIATTSTDFLQCADRIQNVIEFYLEDTQSDLLKTNGFEIFFSDILNLSLMIDYDQIAQKYIEKVKKNEPG